jgi:glutamate-5-semialdehyde dehydrogenase
MTTSKPAISDEPVLTQAEAAKLAAAELSMSSAEQRNKALLAAADSIDRYADDILAANNQDLTEAQKLSAEGNLSAALLSRLELSATKLRGVTAGVRQVAALPDPLGLVTYASELDHDLRLFRVACPIGLIAVIFESRPDALPQIASLCLKSGNAVILKGGREALNTNRALFNCIRSGFSEAGIPENVIALLESRQAADALLQADGVVDLIIPRGSNDLVRHIQDNTRIPVLAHAEGVCHLYIDDSADIEKAIKITIDGKTQYPSACNTVETLLVHEAIAERFLPPAAATLARAGVELRADEQSAAILAAAKPSVSVKPATDEDWSTEYCDLVLSVKIVPSLQVAIRHINTFGSHHTDAIVTESSEAFDTFFAQVDSAGVYLNASTRFADGFRYGFGAEVGISTGKLHPRGPVGLEGLVTYKYKLQGNGHVVAEYSGDNARSFIHRPIHNP